MCNMTCKHESFHTLHFRICNHGPCLPRVYRGYFINIVSVLFSPLQGKVRTNSLIAYYESVVRKYACGKSTALHLGCGPGYTSLMLSKMFASVRDTHILCFICLLCPGCRCWLLWTFCQYCHASAEGQCGEIWCWKRS